MTLPVPRFKKGKTVRQRGLVGYHDPIAVELNERLRTATSLKDLDRAGHELGDAFLKAQDLRARLMAALGEWPNFRPISCAELGLEQGDLASRAAVLHCLAETGLYVLPTVELVDFLRTAVPQGQTCLEIGAGSGWLARLLGWRACDSRAHLGPVVTMRAQMTGSRLPKPPPDDVIAMDALECAQRLKPEAVVGLYITHFWDYGTRTGSALGIDDREIFRLPSVRKYVLVGNVETHSDRPLMRRPHETIRAPPWLWIRGTEPRVWIWSKA